jgi:hypothetical protein
MNTAGVSSRFDLLALLFGFLQKLLELRIVYDRRPHENGDEYADHYRHYAQNYRGDPESSRPFHERGNAEDQTGDGEYEVQKREYWNRAARGCSR